MWTNLISEKEYLTEDLNNSFLEEKINEFNKNSSEKNLQNIKQEVFNLLKKNYEIDDEWFGLFSITEMKTDDDGNEGCYSIYIEKDGLYYEVFYTNSNEMLKGKNIGENFEIGIVEMQEVFRKFEAIYLDDESCGGFALNPYGKNPFFIPKDVLTEICNNFNSEIF